MLISGCTDIIKLPNFYGGMRKVWTLPTEQLGSRQWSNVRFAGHRLLVTETGESKDGSDSVGFDLPPNDKAPSIARADARDQLKRWSLTALVEPLSLVVSELVSNAVRHGRPPFKMLMRRLGRGVRVDVHDEGHTLDSDTPEAGASNEGGRGLLIVKAVSTDYGVDQIPDGGKRVWAVVEPEAEASER